MRAPSESLQIGIIGYGLAGSVFHAPLIAATPGLSVGAIVTANPARREQAGKDHPSATLFATPEELFTNAPRLDAVVVATPNPTHAALAEAAVAAGLSVVVDKPFARNPQEARKVIELARRAGKLLTVFHNRRWDGDFLTLRKLLADGLVGTPVQLESRYERFRPEPRREKWHETIAEEDGGGILNDLGTHIIDQAIVLFGAPASVYAEIARRRAGVIVDDDVFLALRFAGGEVAHLWASNIPRLQGPRFRLVGMRGVYEKHGIDPQEGQLRAGVRPGDRGFGRESQEQWGRLAGEEQGRAVDRTYETLPGRYDTFYAGFRDALRGEAPVPVDPEDAVRVLSVIEAARRSC